MFLTSLLVLFGCSNNTASVNKNTTNKKNTTMEKSNIEIATLGGGCFWCLEAVFQRMDGVLKTESGYAGGNTQNPTYKEVCSGTSNHAEVIQITYDTTKISFADLLKVFFTMHNPTTLNQQGNDIGTQYRSVIFYHNELQKETALKIIKLFEDEQVYSTKIVTVVEPYSIFYKAEDYHQNYYNNNTSQGYCQFVIQPKIEKFEHVFKPFLKH